MQRVFVHGTGTAGARAWPLQQALAEASFVERVHDGDHPDFVVPAIHAALAPQGHLVAHSYGCLSAILAAGAAPGEVASLVLCEPPFLSLTAQRPRSLEHIARLRPVFERRDREGIADEDLVVGFATAVGMPPPHLSPGQLATAARRLRAFTPAWLFEVDPTVVQRIPTLVVSSGADDFYDEIAAELQRHGARRVLLPGTGHRVQDHPRATATFREFWAQANGTEPVSRGGDPGPTP